MDKGLGRGEPSLDGRHRLKDRVYDGHGIHQQQAQCEKKRGSVAWSARVSRCRGSCGASPITRETPVITKPKVEKELQLRNEFQSPDWYQGPAGE